MRQQIADFLLGRQSSQGERLANFLSEGFAAPDTAAARTEALTRTRDNAAAANYARARKSAGTVDPTEAIKAADDFVMPGAQRIMSPRNNIRDDSVEAAVNKAKSFLTDGTSILSDFQSAFRAKLELDAMVDRAAAVPTVQRQLIPIRNKLDDALAAASPEYAGARDMYHKQSQVIDAVDTGKLAASPRTRADNNLRDFAVLTPEQKSAFRAGYVDPHIAKVEAASSSPTTNKARMLLTTKNKEEFPAFAVPNKADEMMRRLGREQSMFETGNAALGNSKTADNLADMEDISNFDPAVMARLFRGDVLGAAAQGAKQAMQLGKGLPPRVVERLGKTLIETNPDAAATVLRQAQTKRISNEQLRKKIYDMLIGATGQQVGQNAGAVPFLK
jgi:hypothetical protein